MNILSAVLGLHTIMLFAGYAQQSEIVIIKIPFYYSGLNNAELITRLVIRPSLDKTTHIFAADTTLNTLEVCGGDGVYSFGRGPTDHSFANYRVVTRVGDELQYVRNNKSRSSHKRLIDSYYSCTLIRDKCFTYKHRASLTVQVAELVKANNRKISSDQF